MQRSENKLFAHMSRDAVVFQGSVRGAGAAAPTVTPTTFSATSSILYMAASDNYVSGVAGDIVRSGAGVYTIKFKDSIPVVWDIIARVWGTDGKSAQVLDYNPTTRIVSINVFTADAGVAVDLATTDTVRLTVIGMLSVPTY